MAGESPAAVLHDSSGQERGHQSAYPVFVKDSSDSAEFEWVRQSVTEADLPARLESGNAGPFDIGGQTLTIAVNGTSDPQTFPTRAAHAGVFVSGQYPSLNGGTEKIKVIVDGGAEEEIEIGKNLTTHDAIAASIQTEIRANVANGTNVTCEWNTTEYPFRFVVTSGTVGSGSYVNLRKGGDDCAILLKLDATVGGFRDDGLDADYYHSDEVPDLLSGLGGTVVSALASGHIVIETSEFGSSKSLQVTAGGANTAFGFPTTITNGATSAGATNMNVDGSTTVKRFELRAGAKTFVATEMVVMLRSDNAAVLKNFGVIGNGITNGLLVQVRSQDGSLNEWFLAKSNSDLLAWSSDGTAYDDAYDSGGKDLISAKFHLNPALTLRGGSLDAIRFSVQDDLTSINSLKAYLFGRSYEVT